MALFEYRAIDKSGKARKGKIDAPTQKQAATKIKGMGLHLVSISGIKTGMGSAPQKQSAAKRSGIRYEIITDFTRQMAILLSTGIPYDKAFDILIEETGHPALQQVLDMIKARIIEGSSLAGALDDHPAHFSKMYVAMVRAGEAGGTLDEVLSRLAESRERISEIKSKVQKALIYPAIMTLMGLGIVVFMVAYIIPKIVPIFQQFDVQLPLPTRIVLAVSDIITGNGVLILILLVLSLVITKRLLLTQRGEFSKDWLLLKLPVIGSLIKKTVVFRFTQTLGTLLQSGVELKQSLEIVKLVIGNRIYQDRFNEIIPNITQRGMDLSQALRQSGIFPASVVQMIRVGEESSQLETMLNKVSTILETEVKQTLEKSIALLEPALILWMAVSVGFIVLAVMLPMMKMNQLL